MNSYVGHIAELYALVGGLTMLVVKLVFGQVAPKEKFHKTVPTGT